MRQRLTKNNVLTIPNFLSLFRLLLIPVIIWLYCGPKNYPAAIVAIALSALSDLLDGKIARRFNMISDLGKVLDPIADKLTQAALIFCLASRYRWMWALISLFIIKEGFMALYGGLTLKLTDTVNGAQWYGKVSTAVLYAVMMALILFPSIPGTAVNILIALCGGVLLLSFLLYARFYRRILTREVLSGPRSTALWVVTALSLAVWAIAVIVCIFR